jgi:integrase
MASISHDKKTGRRMIQFTGPDGKRRSIRLGKASRRYADMVKPKVEDLVAARITGGSPCDETSRWLADLDEGMLKKLAAVDLIELKPEQQGQIILEPFLDDYINRRTDVKKSTRTVLSHTRRNLVEYFGPDKAIRDITPGDADEWANYLRESGLAENTVRRRCGIAKQYFRAAIRKKYIQENPFLDLRSTVKGKRDRDFFITREMAEKILDACPDAEWRLIFALSRFGGLRCPSEHLALRWTDIDWENERITLRSPKTEHHEGCESRQIPIFPELLPYLREVFENAEPGSEFVIGPRYQGAENLRTQFNRIIRRAGLDPWPKPFQNLRATRETELAETYPIHVVCAWIGNSQQVAAKHYLQVTDEHYKQALQNPVQQTAASGRTDPKQDHSTQQQNVICDTIRGISKSCDDRELEQLGDRGLEPLTSRV